MRRAENLITMARKLSGNTRYDSDSGVPQDVFVQYLVNAHNDLLMQVVNLKTKFLLKKKTVDVVRGQILYAWPEDCYLQHMSTLQWSQTPTQFFTTLFKSYDREAISTQIGYPFSYIPCEEGYQLNPPLSAGLLYLHYIREPNRPQKRAGQITVATQSGGNLTALSVATTGSYDETEINSDYYLCVVDKYGVQKAKNIPYDSVSGGVFTISSYALSSTDSIAVGDYICVGKNCENLPFWPDVCESYLIDYMVYSAKYGDSSQWSAEAVNYMNRAFEKLSGSFSTLSDDIIEIPTSNLDYLSLV